MFGKKERTEPRQGFIKRLRARLNKGDSWLTYDLANLAPGGKIDEEVLDDLEAELVMADVGIDTTERIIADLQSSLKRNQLKDVAALRAARPVANGTALAMALRRVSDGPQLARQVSSAAKVGLARLSSSARGVANRRSRSSGW